MIFKPSYAFTDADSIDCIVQAAAYGLGDGVTVESYYGSAYGKPQHSMERPACSMTDTTCGIIWHNVTLCGTCKPLFFEGDTVMIAVWGY